MSLYHKYRPPTLEDIRGNSDMIPILQEMLSDKTKCTHAFLLYGPTGCGKTTIGRIIAKDLGCKGRDFREVDSADFRGIDTIRKIRENSQFKPLEGSCRVWLIDECHKLTNDAQNALLKILEDTPQHVYFILCTTEPQRLLGTIKGRCSQFQVKPLNERQMFGLLRSVVKAENESIVKTVYEQITQDSFGHPRNALQILDQVLRVDVEQRLEVAQRSAEEQSQSIELCRALVAGGAWKEVRVILNGLKDQEPESIRRHVLGYAQGVLLKGDNIRAGLVLEEFVEPFWNSGYPGLVHACYAAIKN
ncbi:MAG TPA: AAA family ATPase [bacterium]|nr:AAA family ATPase [bacterium]